VGYSIVGFFAVSVLAAAVGSRYLFGESVAGAGVAPAPDPEHRHVRSIQSA
jgi:hypothetical protein